MSASENKELVRKMFTDLGKGDAQAFMAAMAEDIRFTIIGTTRFSGTFKGKQELAAKLLGPLGAALEGGLVITPENLIADGDFVAMQSRGKSIAKNGKRYDNTYCQIFRFSNGKIHEVTEYLDTELVTSVFGK
ncbi:MAG TPA: nuclear transport factor 2 family protein [Candidatus Binataceae bacterium]|nr:nuclear transport factor 2 family protein [Candidatus Binataceae bacterium]